MKKIAFLSLVAFILIGLTSCDTNSRAFSEMQSICEDIEENFDKYTEKDFKEITARFAEIEEKMEARDLDDDEKQELAKLKGRYYGAFTKGAINSAKDEIKRIGNKVGSAIEGFVEGVK